MKELFQEIIHDAFFRVMMLGLILISIIMFFVKILAA